MKSLQNRVKRIENSSKDLDIITIASIFDDNLVRIGQTEMTFEEYERDHLPGRKKRAAAIFERTGKRPITTIDFRSRAHL